jgi:hypothetical protein
MNYHYHLTRAVLLLSLSCFSAAAQPLIASFFPTAGAPGDSVTLIGSGFTTPGGIVVRFWQGQVATSGRIISDSQLTVTVPTSIQTGPISVQALGGGSENFTSSDFTAIGTGPYIVDVSPNFGKPNDLVVISGAHFFNVPQNGVSFGGQNATDAAANADGTQINVHVPFGATNGPVSVTTPFGTSNSPTAFTILGPGPFITGFSPQIGTAGVTIFINGVQFTGVTNATFNGQPGVNFTVTSDTLIRVDAPAGVTSGPLTVNSPKGSWTTSSNFFVPPTISSFSPTSGRAGTNLVLIGANFLGVSSVTFNGKAATFTNVSNTNISVAVPTGASTGTLRVITPAGSAFSATNFVVLPLVTGFSPAFGAVGTPVVITGANLNEGTPVVLFNGVGPAATTNISFGQLTAVVPTGTTTGPISVTTTNGSYTNVNLFYLPATITNFSPTNSGAGTTVTITGQNFTDTTDVSFNGTPASSFAFTNNITLRATVPQGVTTGPISVTTPAGSVSSTALFYGFPVITNFAPTHGLPGTNVVLSGTSFLGATSVRFNGTSATFTVANNNRINTTVPNGAVAGPITVVAPAGTNTSSANFVLDFFTDLSVSITGSPNPVMVGSNLLYTIKVSNNGPLDAPDVRLTNMLPATATLESVTLPDSWFAATNGNPIEAGVNSLAVNSSATLLVTVAPQSAGSITSSVSVGSGYSDPGITNNAASVTTSVTPLALLAIQALGNQVQISWSLALTNYVLESKSVLATNVPWSTVAATPVIVGGSKVVAVPNSGTATYYRLRK